MSLKGVRQTEEHRRKIGLANKGKIRSGECKKHLSKINKGKHLSEETKKKIGLNGFHYGMLGKHHSEEWKRKMSERLRGEKCYLWQGGKSFEPYSTDWTKTLKRSIRERDHYTCQLCGALQENRAFSVHHIDYDKKNCNPNNLITLCLKCHMKTNFKRNYWVKLFISSLEGK